MTTPQTTAETQRYTRMDRATITPDDGPANTGAAEVATETARALCQALRGTTWHAELRTNAWPHPAYDQRAEIAVTVQPGHLVTVTHTTPAGTYDERWTITVNGEPVAHRPFTRELPSTPQAIARSVWRHVAAITVDPCDSLGCTKPATIARYTGSTCPSHAS
jgi:hypothetical protein